MKTSWVGALTVGVLLVTSMAAAAYYNVTGPVEVLVPRGARGAIITLAFAPDSTTGREWLSGLLISDLSLESPMIIAAWVKAFSAEILLRSGMRRSSWMQMGMVSRHL